MSGVVVPDVAGTVTGWRLWRVADEVRVSMTSVTRDDHWPGRAVFEAYCPFGDPETRGPLHDAGIVPVEQCTCGVYAKRSLLGLLRTYDPEGDPSVMVCGTVDLWGKVIEGEDGYRAACAYPKRLWVVPPQWQTIIGEDGERHMRDANTTALLGALARRIRDVYGVECGVAHTPDIARLVADEEPDAAAAAECLRLARMERTERMAARMMYEGHTAGAAQQVAYGLRYLASRYGGVNAASRSVTTATVTLSRGLPAGVMVTVRRGPSRRAYAWPVARIGWGVALQVLLARGGEGFWLSFALWIVSVVVMGVGVADVSEVRWQRGRW